MTAPVPRAAPEAPPPSEFVPPAVRPQAGSAEPTFSPAVPADGGWRRSLLVGFWTWLAGLITYGVVTAVAWVPFGTPPELGKAYEQWNQWDTVWYVIIAEYGYEYDSRSVAFFPLYPMLVRGADLVLPRGLLEAALVVSALACYAALVMVHRLACEIIGPKAATRAPFYLLAFPTGFYLFAAYTESLFIALSVGALYFMRRRQWWAAGVLGGFASATRFVGVLLMLAFGYEYLRQRGFQLRRIRLDVLAVALVPVGLLVYAYYCWRVFGDPFAFNAAQRNWFRQGYEPPWSVVLEVIRQVDANPEPLGGDTFRNVANLTTALLMLLVLALSLDPVLGLGPRDAYLAIYSIGIILLPMIRPIHTHYPLSSMWRFALACVPVFLVLAKHGRSPTFDRLYLMPALALQGVMVVTFLHKQFVG